MEPATIAALTGALVGGTISTASNLALETFRAGRRAEQLSHAIAGEIIAILELIARRRYLEYLKELATRARRGDNQVLKVRTNSQFFATIEANLDSIGLLPAELPILIPRFLTAGKAMLIDLEELYQSTQSFSSDELVSRYEGLIDLIEEATKTGRSIVTLVTTFYGSPHTRLPLRRRLTQLRLRLSGGLKRAESQD